LSKLTVLIKRKVFHKGRRRVYWKNVCVEKAVLIVSMYSVVLNLNTFYLHVLKVCCTFQEVSIVQDIYIDTNEFFIVDRHLVFHVNFAFSHKLFDIEILGPEASSNMCIFVSFSVSNDVKRRICYWNYPNISPKVSVIINISLSWTKA